MILSEAVRTAYFQALNGVISASVFDAFALPERTPYPYVLLSTQLGSQREVTDGKVYDCSMLIDIVTGSTDPIGREQAEAIAAEIDDIINPDDGSDLDLTPYGYSMGDTNMEQSFDDSQRNGIFYIYRKLVRYSHIAYKI